MSDFCFNFVFHHTRLDKFHHAIKRFACNIDGCF